MHGEFFRASSGIFLSLIAAAEADQPTRVVELLNRLAIEFLAFSGVVAESMTRGHAWRFLDMGNRVERAIVSSRLMRATLGTVIAG